MVLKLLVNIIAMIDWITINTPSEATRSTIDDALRARKGAYTTRLIIHPKTEATRIPDIIPNQSGSPCSLLKKYTPYAATTPTDPCAKLKNFVAEYTKLKLTANRAYTPPTIIPFTKS